MNKLTVKSGSHSLDEPKGDAIKPVNSTFKRIRSLEKRALQDQSDLTTNRIFLDQSYYKTDD